MFSRKKLDAPLVEEEDTKVDGKGRPTPTRKEAEAAAKQRAKASIDPKDRSRQARVSNSAKVREAMRTGDERYLPARDKGPVKRLIRDWVDARVSFIEFVLPLLVIIMIMSYSQNKTLQGYGIGLEFATLLLVVVEGGWIVFGVRRAVRNAFPDEPLRGITTYTLLRAMNMRFLRMPKTQVSPGGKPKNR